MQLRRELGYIASGVKVAIVVGLAAFVVRISLHRETVRNGVQTECTYLDVFAFVAAVVCLVGAADAARTTRHKVYGQRRTFHVVAAVVLVGSAGVHALRGAGLILSPC